MSAVRDETKDIYRVIARPPDFADSIAYTLGLEAPEIDTTVPGLIEYYFKTCNVTVAVDNYDTKGNAQIRVWAGEGEMAIGIAFQQINLMSQRAVSGLVKELNEAHPEIPNWRDIVKNVAWRTAKTACSVNQVQLVGTEPETMRQDFRLYPVIHEGEPTTIFCPGGVGKSYLAVYCACLVQFDYAGFTDASGGKMWAPKQGNVLYLDWESSYRDHLRRTWAVKRGLGIDSDDDTGFLYLYCTQPLTAIISDILTLIEKNSISLVIIDSQMAAADFGPDIGQNATRFFNAVRQFNCSTLILDHVAKSAMQTTDDTNNVGPHGSVVKANRSRQQYELKKYQVPGQAHTDLVLLHRKNNEGMLSEAFGLRIAFVNDDQDHLARVEFTSYDVDTHPMMSQTLAIWRRIWFMLEEGAMTVRELAEALPDKGEPSIRATLNQNKGKFTKLEGDRWGRGVAQI